MKGKITLIQILLVFVLIICGVKVYDGIKDKRADEANFETLKKNEVTQMPDSEKQTDTQESIENKLNKYRELYAGNDEFAGWIKIPGTRIDYPVMHNTQSNAYYLHRNYDRQYSSSGIPFMDYQSNRDATSDNTIIYAHNMRNGTMFHDLLEYADKDFFEAHKIIEFDTVERLGKYEIFAVIRTKVGSAKEFKYYDFINAPDAASFDGFIAECIKRSLHKTEIIPEYGSKILTLSTCSYNTDNERFVVFAKKITV